MTTTGEQNVTFAANLFDFAGAVRRARNLAPSGDPTDAAVLVAAEIVVKTVPPDAFFNAARSSETSRKLGAFLCFVVSSILIQMKQEGFSLPQNEVLVAAFLGVYQMHNRDTTSRLLVEGVRRYTAILQAAGTDAHALDYVTSLNEAVRYYVITQDPDIADRLTDLYAAVAEVEEADKQ